MAKHELGDVVCVRMPKAPDDLYGVVVGLPGEQYPLYRVRLRTDTFERYVEVGALESELVAEPEELRRRRQDG